MIEDTLIEASSNKDVSTGWVTVGDTESRVVATTRVVAVVETVGEVTLTEDSTSVVEERTNSVTAREVSVSIFEVVNDVVLSGTSNVENDVIVSATLGVAGRSV